jgi:transcriptional regulator with XRE-family HTH domain
MSSRRKTAIRAWRVYRGLTLRQLADLGRIERGIQPYSQDTLEAIAAALEVDPFVLLTPDDPGRREKIAPHQALTGQWDTELFHRVLRCSGPHCPTEFCLGPVDNRAARPYTVRTLKQGRMARPPGETP